MITPNPVQKNCLFCKIIRREIPAEFIRESADSVVIRDISPQAPFHFLILPKRHARDLADFMTEKSAPSELSDLFSQAVLLAKERGFDLTGHRLVLNTGEEGGQTVHHLHIHFLSGRMMGWPPG